VEESQVVSLIVVAVAALPVLFGLFRVHMKNGINAKAFVAVASKLLEADNPDRFEKLLRAADVPLMRLLLYVWEHRWPPEAPVGGFEGYRAVEAPATYLERLGPAIRPEVERVRSAMLRAWLWTLPAFLTLPVLFFSMGAPSASVPWIIAGVLCLMSLLSLPAMVGQRGDVHTALAQLVPYFERYAERRST